MCVCDMCVYGVCTHMNAAVPACMHMHGGQRGTLPCPTADISVTEFLTVLGARPAINEF